MFEYETDTGTEDQEEDSDDSDESDESDEEEEAKTNWHKLKEVNVDKY